MKYLEYTFNISPNSGDIQDILGAVLADAGFDSFVKNEEGKEPLKAYVKKDEFSEERLKEVLVNFPLPAEISYEGHEAEDKDWNAEWEANFFEPLNIDNRCVISAPFHKDVPTVEYNVKINPRMSFGSGHHETTSQMIREILNNPMEGRTVLDMGCGTSLLAILASMRGATTLTAIDNDEWCVLNSKENFELNHISNINVLLGDASLLPQVGPFDVIFANIHLNIILADMEKYVSRLNVGGLLFVSGFYYDDLPRIKAGAERLGLIFDHAGQQRNWCCAAFRKP